MPRWFVIAVIGGLAARAAAGPLRLDNAGDIDATIGPNGVALMLRVAARDTTLELPRDARVVGMTLSARGTRIAAVASSDAERARADRLATPSDGDAIGDPGHVVIDPARLSVTSLAFDRIVVTLAAFAPAPGAEVELAIELASWPALPAGAHLHIHRVARPIVLHPGALRSLAAGDDENVSLGIAPLPAPAPVRPPSVSVREIRRAMRYAQPRFRHCYEQRLMTGAPRAIAIDLRFAIGPDGSVTPVLPIAPADTTALVACLNDVVGSLTFRPGAAAIEVSYPLELHAAHRRDDP